MTLISVCVPSFNEQEVLPQFYREVARVASTMPDVEFEFVFIDDGSSDGTVDVVKSLRQADPRVRLVSFSRNFGKEAAMYAGLKEARGDFITLMDADLQDPPELLGEMYRALVEEGYDCAAARRTTRAGESRVRSFFAHSFYSMFNAISKTELVSGARDYRLMTRQMVDAVLELAEYNRFTKGIFAWVGFRTKWVEYENTERAAGTTKWSFWGLMKYSLSGFVDFSTVPLAFASAAGLVFCGVAFLGIAVVVVRTMLYGDPVAGWPSLAVIVLFVGGIQLFSIGILGQYLARTYLETKRRPIYIVREQEG